MEGITASETKQEKQPCFVALIRHGERADAAPKQATSKKWEVYHDPPLTDKGIKQAYETGLALKKFLYEDQACSEVILECSPFLRTLMTAAQIAKGIGHAKIRINYLYCELLAGWIFEECPLE